MSSAYETGNAKEVDFTDFAPDKDRDAPGIILDAQGAFPTVSGYQAFNQALPHIYGPLPETPLGSTIGNYSTGEIQFFAGGYNHLYALQGTLDDPASVWTPVDSLGPNGSFQAKRWRFTQFNDDMIAVGGAQVKPQVAATSAGGFGLLAGSPPVGATIALAVNSQVMMFVGNTWYVSAIGSDKVWVTNTGSPINGTQVQSGFAPITDLPGSVVAAQVLQGRQVIVFKNQGIWLMSYVGGDSIWSVVPISDVNGTWSQECTHAIPEGIAFFGLDDFYFSSGYTPQRIPNNLKEWFFDTADVTQFVNMTSRYDPYHAISYWHFVSKQPPFAGIPDRFVAYNFRAKRWVCGYLSTPCVPIPNYQFGAVSGVNGFYFDTSNVLQTFRGPAGPMRILTGYMGTPGKITALMGVKPKYNIIPASATLQGYHVVSLGNVDRQGASGVLARDGWFYLRQTDRYHRVQLEVSGSGAPIGTENLLAGAEVSGFSFQAREAGDR